MTAFLKTLLVLTVAGTLCGLFLVALRKLAKGKVPSTFLYYAWLVVLLRFAVPVNGLVPVGKEAPRAETPRPAYTEPQPIDAESEITVVPSSYSHTEAPASPVQNQPVTYQPVAEPSAVKKAVSVPTILFAVWCCGTAVFLLWNVIPYIRFSKALWSTLSMPSEDDIRIYDDLCGTRKPSLARSDLINTPLTFGLFRHIIVIPDIEYDADALKIILSHEIVHYKRHDIFIKWIAMLVFSMHWFNPFTWYFRKELESVCELSCDEKLLKNMNRNEKRSYGETLISIAENACKTKYEMTTGFSGGKRDLKERLLQIMSFKKKSKLAVAVALVPVVILCGCAAVLGPKTEKSSGTGVVSVSDVDELLAAIAPDTEIHLAAGTYNLTEAANYGKDEASKYYHWNSYGFEGQYELCIEDVDGLSIVGDNAEILTVPRSSNVLAFKDCNKLSLRGLTVGHTEAAQACEGGVIRLDTSDDVSIEQCRLYGCGTVGVWADGCGNLKVSDTEIYHCSSAGISYQYATGLAVDSCSIYDCGKPEKYQGAATAFLFFDARDIVLRNCDIQINYLQTFLQGNAKELSFEGIRVCDNHISSVFHYDGDARFKDVAFEGNTVDKWMAEGQAATILIDGKKATEEELTTMWGEQMSAGVGAAEADFQPIDRFGAKDVHVKTADEFLSAIASDTTVYIDVPQIDLTSASDYGEGATEEYMLPEFGDKAYAWVYCFDGYELYIGNIRNFHIVGGEIVTQPRYANVLNYLNCGNVTLDGVHLGHTPEQGTCAGGVLFFENTDVIILEGCDLYGCGILGITTRNVNNIHVQNTLIHNCSYGAAVLEDTNEAVFLGCDVVNCPDPHFSLRGCTDFSWDNKLMDPHSSFNVNADARNPYEEALNSVTPTSDILMQPGSSKSAALNVACIVVDAYVKGYDGFERIIQGHLSRTSAIGVSSEITACDFPVYYEITEERNFPEDTSLNLDRVRSLASGGLISAEDIVPVEMVQICKMDGIDEITGDEPEGATRTIDIYCRTSTEHPERESSYFKVDLIVEDGCWRVVRF